MFRNLKIKSIIKRYKNLAKNDGNEIKINYEKLESTYIIYFQYRNMILYRKIYPMLIDLLKKDNIETHYKMIKKEFEYNFKMIGE